MRRLTKTTYQKDPEHSKAVEVIYFVASFLIPTIARESLTGGSNLFKADDHETPRGCDNRRGDET